MEEVLEKLLDNFSNLMEKALKYLNTKYKFRYADLRLSFLFKRSFGFSNIHYPYESRVLKGFCVRLLNSSWGFSYTSDININSIKKCINISYKMSKIINKKVNYPITMKYIPQESSYVKIIDDSFYEIDEKILFAKHIFKTLNCEKIVDMCVVDFGERLLLDIMCNPYGAFIAQIISKERLMIQLWSKEKGGIKLHESWGVSGDSLCNKLSFKEDIEPLLVKLVNKTKARRVSPGFYDVVAGPHVMSTIVHECIGHNIEADTVVWEHSLFSDLIGKKITNEQVTIIDDPTIRGAFGFYVYDHECVKAKRTKIIEQGVLKKFIHSIETASILKVMPTGHARAGSFKNIPLVRMSNTLLLPGNCKQEELLSELKNGILLSKAREGTVDELGNFSITIEEGYLIDKGDIKYSLKDFTISGNVRSLLNNIVLVASDFRIAFAAYCEKYDQQVSVSAGAPSVLIKNIKVN